MSDNLLIKLEAKLEEAKIYFSDSLTKNKITDESVENIYSRGYDSGALSVITDIMDELKHYKNTGVFE